MTAKKKAIAIISEYSENKDFDKDDVDAAFQYLKTASEEDGLAEDDIDELVEIVVNGKLSSTVYNLIIQCLVPETSVSEKAIEKMVAWFFILVTEDTIGKSVQRHVLQWLTGIVYYDLADTSVMQKYYYSLFFMLKNNHSESIIGKLLYLLTKPEDAKRWMVKQLLDLQAKYGMKAHITSLLSILKSYRPDVVPEKVPMMSFDCPKSGFMVLLQKSHSRKLSETERQASKIDELSWQMGRISDKRSKPLGRLIPSAVGVSFDSSVAKKDKIYSIYEFKSMIDVGANQLQTAIPAQTMSLLANPAGYHLLVFSDVVTKSRFSYKLNYTLFRVFVWELEPYSHIEKENFLKSLVGLQIYMHQGMPVVTQFLFRYLLIWDGVEFCDEILDLLTWVTNAPVQGWRDFIFHPLRQIFRSADQQTKIKIIETMGKIICNLVAVSKREKYFFISDFEDEDYVKTIQDIGDFTNGLVTEGLLWNSEEGAREMETAALEFYETCQQAGKAGDLPIMILMPTALVYKCLFSSSRLCLSIMCSVFLSYETVTIERLQALGAADDFEKEITKLHVFMLDAYRCLWSTTRFQPSLVSYLFQEQAWEELCIKFKNDYQVNIQAGTSIALDRTFSDGQTNGRKERIMHCLNDDYPSIIQFKELFERQLLPNL